MTDADTNPQGVIALIISPDGDVIATVSDFDRSGYGGFKPWQAQRLRARRNILWEVIRVYSGPILVGCLSDYLIEQIGRALLDPPNGKLKHKLVLRSIGWPDDVCEEIER